ncbi:MAG: signal recognition particle-docking protein FtsY [Bdellovibrionales bacterium]|nr:signal recognition particle-docking protein FtsY [Bdellovibrionales bacterium]
MPSAKAEVATKPLDSKAFGVSAEAKAEEKPRSVQPKDLKDALANTKNSIFGRIKNVFSSEKNMSEAELEELEEALYTSDIGPITVQRLVEAVGEKLDSGDKANFSTVCETLKSEMLQIFSKFNESEDTSDDEPKLLKSLLDGQKPKVWMIVGVNGAGKTTTIGKLAHATTSRGLKTLVVAGDTFRAAAGEQLDIWKQRAGAEIFSPEGVKDPSAVAFDGCQMAKAQGYDVVLLDTAGRLHTQNNLMDELVKMKRVVQKVLPEAPHETLIVLDANSGQNALIQTQKFNEAIGLTGVVLTKLDGSAKGGVAIGLANEFSLPIKVIGVGEGINDLRKFKPQEFVDSII